MSNAYKATSFGGSSNSLFDPMGLYNKGEDVPQVDFYGMAQQQSYANRVNSNTPWGSQNYTTREVTDPATGKKMTVWDSNTTLDPRLQAALGSQMQTQQNLSGLAEGLTGSVADSLSQPFSYGGIADAPDYTTAMNDAIQANYAQAASRLDPQWAKREEGTRTQLVNQGLDPTSEAYRSQMSDLGQQRTDAYDTAMRSAIGQGNDTASTSYGIGLQGRQQAIAEYERQRQQPLNELQSLMSGQQVNMPSFPDTEGAGSYQGAAQQDYQQLLDQYNANAADKQNKQQGMMQIGGTIAAMF